MPTFNRVKFLFRSNYLRVRNKILNFDLNKVSAKTLFLTAGVLLLIVISSSVTVFLPQQNPNQAPNQISNQDEVPTSVAADDICAQQSNANTCDNNLQCIWNYDDGSGQSNANTCERLPYVYGGANWRCDTAIKQPYVTVVFKTVANATVYTVSVSVNGSNYEKTIPHPGTPTGTETTFMWDRNNPLYRAGNVSSPLIPNDIPNSTIPLKVIAKTGTSGSVVAVSDVNATVSIPYCGDGSGGGGGIVPTAVPLPPAPSCTGPWCENINLYGNDVGHYNNERDNNGFPATAQDCQIGCQQDNRCVAWTFQKDTKDCWLKNPVPGEVYNDNNTTSGIKSGTSVPPPANNCTGPSKVLCGNQCYGVVAGACNNWQCVNGAPKCADSQPTAVPTSSQGGIAPTATRTPTPRPPTNTPRPPTATNTPQPNSPTATNTPIPQGNPTATNTPPVGPGTLTPTNTPGANQPTSTPIPGGAVIALTLSLPGIGSDTSAGENNSPTPTSRSVEVKIIDPSGQEKTASGQLTYDPSAQAFKGNVSFATNPGTYTIKSRFNNTLWKTLSALNLNANQTSTAPATELVSGDINQDNVLNLLDYNILISCYGTKSCSQKTQSDLNMDGKVDEKDLNIFYTRLATRNGD